MAELICAYCDQPLRAGAMYCPRCGGNQDEAAPAVDGFSCEAGPVGTASSAPPAPSSGACPECQAAVDGAATTCRYCGAPLANVGGRTAASVARVVLPNGTKLTVGDQPLRLGRDEDSCAVADQLAGFGNISRAHAMITCDRLDLRLTDLGSTNGTFVNDVRLDPHRPTPVADGDRVRLAADCELRVSLTADHGAQTREGAR